MIKHLPDSSEGCADGYELNLDGSCTLVYEDLTNTLPEGGLDGCGNSASGRIVGGEPAGDWPWLVRLQIDGSEIFDQCTGTILDRESILTTARCCHAAGSAENINVHVGNGSFSVRADSFAQHPDFDAEGVSLQSKSSDVCVVKVPNLKNSQSDDCNDCFTSVCLSSSSYQPGRACWTAGWGATELNGENSVELQSVGMNILPWDHCEAMSSYMFFQLSKDVEFCAGLPDVDDDGLTETGAGPCSDDQGAPLICDDNGSAVLYGIYSWSTKCGEPGFPAIYADTNILSDFITGQMGEGEQTWVEPQWEAITDNEITPGLSCGNPESSARLMGGSVTSGGWDFMVSISTAPLLANGLLDSTAGVNCGGVIVDDEWILTSADCCQDNLDDVTVGVYDANFKNLEDGQFYRTPRQVVVSDQGACMMRVDPLYWGHTDSDGNAVEPKYSYACLPQEHDVAAGTKCWTAGWGETNSDGSFSNKLRSLALNVYENDYCVAHSDYSAVDSEQFCAANNADQSVTPCSRDTGAPLICAVNGSPVVYGVLVGGNECPNVGNSPALFLKTGSPDLASFIATTMATPEVTTTVPQPGPCGFFGDVPVQWQKKSGKVWFKTQDSAILRLRNFQKQTDFDIRGTKYTGFAMFNRNKCGQDFLNAWTDGRIYRAEIFDSDFHYDIVGQPYYHDASSKHSSITVQYRMHTVADKDLPYSSSKGKGMVLLSKG